MWPCSFALLLLPGLFGLHTICCSILQYTKTTKLSADTWSIDPWVRVVPSFLCASLFQSACIRIGDDVFLVATWNLFAIFTRYRTPLLGAFSCRPSVSRNHLLHACRCWYCGCHPQDTAVGRDRNQYSFSSIIRAVVHGFSSNMRSKLVGLRRIILVFIRIFHATRIYQAFFTRTRIIWYVHTRRTLYEAKQGCGVVSCIYYF